jgi:acetylglutamate/LysW-gamma-L-alpha-aminoadipate kinase
VLSPPAAAADGRLLNVDADRLASAVAVALGARALVLLTDVPGLLTDIADAASVLPRVSVTGGSAAAPHAVRGRMKHKHRAAAEAACGGVPTVIIASGLVPAPVSAALGGAGTSYVRGAEPR